MPAYRVLVSDPISDLGVEVLASHPEIEVDVQTGLSEDQLLPVIGDYDGLIVRSQTKVTPAIFDAAGKLRAALAEPVPAGANGKQ